MTAPSSGARKVLRRLAAHPDVKPGDTPSIASIRKLLDNAGGQKYVAEAARWLKAGGGITTNAVEAFYVAYKEGATFGGLDDKIYFLDRLGYPPLARKTVDDFDRAARNRLHRDGIAIQSPTRENNWSTSGLTSVEDTERSRTRNLRYNRTHTINRAAEVAADAARHGASPAAKAIAKFLQSQAMAMEAIAELEESRR